MEWRRRGMDLRWRRDGGRRRRDLVCESCVRLVARGQEASLVRSVPGFFFACFFYSWLIFVDFFFVACLGRDRWLPNEERGGWWRTR